MALLTMALLTMALLTMPCTCHAHTTHTPCACHAHAGGPAVDDGDDARPGRAHPAPLHVRGTRGPGWLGG
eukprot:scaffold93982_cov72-Phaeocystis_antarctica.AAC.1